MATFRDEKDSLGTVQVPENALYKAQTQRAVDNFPISGLVMPAGFIKAVVIIKRAAARVNCELGLLDADTASAICAAADSLDDDDYRHQFPVDVFQTGSGTSTNMNVNEVLATMASQRLAAKAISVNPNDHLNMGQSSNDVIPTAIQVSAVMALQAKLLPALQHLAAIIDDKGQRQGDVVKTGRTHLMDAMPLTLAQELSGWGFQIRQGIARIESSLPRLYALPQGGTAVGTGINAHPEFGDRIAAELAKITELPFVKSGNFFAGLSSQDISVELSGQLRTVAVSLMKISNDLRWMNSGPLAGLGEIELQALQPGSSIMPGKVNPVIPEAVAMVAAQVMGNDATIAIGGQSGNFQLNVMLPVIAYNLLQSVELLANCARLLADNAIATFKVRQKNLDKALALNPILVTALNPIIGYSKAAEIAKAAYQQQRPIVDVAAEMCDLSRNELEKLLNPATLT
ncbi:MAG: class II fumarate hydratase [Porticoccaceae bacterium]|nr:class II fumarate hydratase [Porticoccaceae bacterium]